MNSIRFRNTVARMFVARSIKVMGKLAVILGRGKQGAQICVPYNLKCKPRVIYIDVPILCVIRSCNGYTFDTGVQTRSGSATISTMLGPS